MILCFLVMYKNKFILLPLFIFLFFTSTKNTFAASANITQLVFTTEPQSVGGETISDTISVQTQNSAGTSEELDETGDLYLSSSLGGEFSSNSTNWTPVDKITMSKGSANRNFYFKSLTSEKNTITARLVGRTSSKEWSATQDFNALDNSTNNSTSSNNVTPTGTSNQTITTTRTVYVSARSSAEDLSNYEENNDFEVSAGRERMATVGSILEFNAKYTVLKNNPSIPSFRWSYGDGTSAVGKDVKHFYKNPGEYQVVLNSSLGELFSVSRTVVKVTTPDISLSAQINGDLEVFNKGKTEINIGGWSLKDGQNTYIFPEDTIIGVNKKVILSKEDIKIDSNVSDRINLNNSANREVSFINNSINKNLSTTTDDITLEKAELLLSAYKASLLAKENVKNQSNKVSIELPKVENTVPEVATVLESVKATRTKSIWQNIVDLPGNTIKKIAHAFYDF